MTGIEPAASGIWTVMTHGALQGSNSADLNSARHGRFREKQKETPTS